MTQGFIDTGPVSANAGSMQRAHKSTKSAAITAKHRIYPRGQPVSSIMDTGFGLNSDIGANACGVIGVT